MKRDERLLEMKKLAQSRGGQCLSTEYANSKTKLEFQCREGHRWFATRNNVLSKGSWCPTCRVFLREAYTRVVFEKIFQKKFIKVRPSWLRNTRGNVMELDGFCDELKIAFEYQGEQHFGAGYYVKDDEHLERRIEDDFQKRKICAEHGIFLVQINYWDDVDDYPLLIQERLEALGFPSTNYDFSVSIDLNVVHENRSRMAEMRELAREKNGQCLSSHFVSMKHSLLWECHLSHRWLSTPSRVKRGDWCNECSGRKAHAYEDVKSFVNAKGGKLLSTIYRNNKTKIRLECAQGHQWETSFNTVLNRGSWCPFCSPTSKGSIEEMREIAESRGGECISSVYVSASNLLKWRCGSSHEWEARPQDIKRGQWCGKCAGNVSGTIEEMRAIANSRGGECLSETYINSDTNLWWRCAKGHTWQATPQNVKGSANKRGSWCGVCAGNTLGNIEEMRSLARSRGGECLSPVYVNSGTKLWWRCAENHEWEAAPREVKGRKNKETGERKGTWCKICSYSGGRRKRQ